MYYMSDKTGTMEFVGTLNLEKGLVDITDPCYDRDTWCRMNDVAVQPGTWNCYIAKTKNKWGTRCAAIIMVHPEHEKANDSVLETPLFVDEIGVDTGLAGFFVSPKRDYSDLAWQEFCDWLFKNEVSGQPTVRLTENSFFSSSGYGDGGYGVYAHKTNGVIDAIKIEFIGDEGED